jgi:hypothetical protein
MASAVTLLKPGHKTWTVADLYRRFGPIAFERIRHDPPPGAATGADVDRIHTHEDRLYELVDGILVEKTSRRRRPAGAAGRRERGTAAAAE